jgi:hypothetical protein
MEPGAWRHRKRSRPSRLADEIPIPTSTSHPCPACGSVFSSLKYCDLHIHHRRDCMATYQQLTRSSSPPALNVRLTGGPFGQHNDAEDVAADSTFGDEPDTSSLHTDRANAESTGSHDNSDHLASVMSEDQNPMASRNVSSMDPHWFEHLPQVARLDSQNTLQFYRTDTGFPSCIPRPSPTN